MERDYTVIIEKDEDGYYVASVPELPGCHTQAKTIDELINRVKEAIEVYLEVESEEDLPKLNFVGIQRVRADVS
ncbi:MAG: type II toxin-antitoxin system HicB family antitoxin [Candidatus Odinarchaeota archaeon]